MTMPLTGAGYSGNAPAGGFTPVGVDKVYFDASVLTSLYEERSGSPPSTQSSVDGVVGSWLNLGTLGGYARAPSDAARPILRTSGGLYWLEFDGSNDVMSLTTPGLGMVDLSMFVPADSDSADIYAGVVILAPTSGGDYDRTVSLVFHQGEGGSDYGTAVFGSQVYPVDADSLIAHEAGSPPFDSALWEFHKTVNTSELIKSGVSTATDNTFTALDATHAGDLIIGARYLGDAISAPFFTGKIYAIGITDVALSSGDKSDRSTFYGNRLGLSI